MLTPDGVKKVDDSTVEFHLTAPNGNFPYLTSSDNYNMIILPNNYDPAKWESSFIGTGPFMLKTYTAKQGASFTRNEQYWGTKALPAATEFTFYDTQTPADPRAHRRHDRRGRAVLRLRRRAAAERRAYNVIRLKSSAHRELSMRCDQAPFTDPRVRQAIALYAGPAGDRQGAVQGLRGPGQRQPVRAGLPLDQHQHRPAGAGHRQGQVAAVRRRAPSGFSTQLIGNDMLEIANYAQIVAQSAQAIGVNISVKMESSAAYYGKATFGNSDWLDATMSLVDYGHRSVPNVFLTAPLQTTNAKKGTGPWNAAHFSNAQYDKLVAASTSRPSTCQPSARSPGRSRPCCWSRRRSSSGTSTTT